MEFTLREWNIADAADLAKAINNPAIHANLRDGIPFPYTEDDAKEFIETTLAAPKDEVFAFALVANGKAAGSIGIFRKENIHNHTAELGYYIAEEYWGKGIMTAAVQEACKTVFATTDILRIFAEPFADNAGSCRVLEKAGFTLEGVMKSNAVKNGIVKDMKLYALVREQ